MVEGNRIRSVAPHSAAAHRGAVVDGTGPDGDARADRVPLAPAEGLRRGAGPRLAGVRRHHGAQSGQHALRGGRGSRGQRSRRPRRPARLRHRLPDGVAARLLQDGRGHFQSGALRDGARARQGAAARPDQELRAAARSAAEADGGVRPRHRRAGGHPRDLPGGAGRRGQHRAHRRHQPPRLLAQADDAAARLRRRRAAVRQERALLVPDDVGRRRAAHLRRRSGAAAGSPLLALPGVDAAAGPEPARRRRRPAAGSTAPATTRC